MKINPTLDTGFCKSRWTLFVTAPFMVLAFIGAGLIASSVLNHGFKNPWYYQAFGLVMLVGVFFLLSMAFLNGISRETVWIAKDEIRIRRVYFFNCKEVVISRDHIKGFQVFMTDILFDVYLHSTDGRKYTVVTSLAISRVDEWMDTLSTIGPVLRSSMGLEKNPAE